MSETLVLLHGFSGTHRAWDRVAAELDPERYRALALDLPGHGSLADARRPITFADCVRHVLDSAPERFVLCGYSMGGRVAMHVALEAPERLSGLVLIACSPGIEDERERAARRAADDQLADALESSPYEDFVERWRTQPLFADDPPEVGELARADQRRNDPLAMAAVLRGLGTGAMRPLWGSLAGIETPTTVLVGQRDEKFMRIGARMGRAIPQARLIVLPGGHGLPLESPVAVAAAIEALGAQRAGY
ncbi:MAG TPA: alpha/beta fold hydrolase [Solirubrobacteraceae bacterium]